MLGCDGDRQADHITVLSYNLQNLFDGIDDGTEYTDFDPSRGAWTAEAADAKASRVARVIRRAVRGGPDVLCLQEVEHGRVVADLARDHLRRRGYRYAAVSETPGSAVEVALLSRVPIADARVHTPVRGWPRRLPDGGEAGAILRPVLEVRLETAGVPLHLFVNHWKSKSGGPRETEPARRAAARVVARRIRAITADAPGAGIIVCGDLNESPHAFDDAGGAYPTALMPLGAGEPSSASHALRVSGDPAAVRRASPAAVLYSPWADAEAPGSYYFRGSWRRLDHTLVSAGLLDEEGWEFAAFEVVAPPFATTADGRPIASRRPGRDGRADGGGRAGGGGFSDHLPVLLSLRRRTE
jgi:endonuclease/exonuclease/phosphatase family metal-dependent hydrolase